MTLVKIGNRHIGQGQPCYMVGEIGINHNGDLAIAKKLINCAALAGADAVKFQKRTLEVVYSAEELDRPRESPFGKTNGELKRALEFGKAEYLEIHAYAEQHAIAWFASCWDEASVDFLESFNPPAYKIASASLTDDHLLKHHRATGRPIILSTGMSTIEQMDHAIDVLGTDNLIVLHATSAYPAQLEHLNLSMIPKLKERYGVPIGYSGHEVGLAASLAAAALGACMIERHITLDRAMWGSDQAASVEPQGLMRLVRDIRNVEISLGSGEKVVTDAELAIMKKLRRVG